jgi:hypothetical protein
MRTRSTPSMAFQSSPVRSSVGVLAIIVLLGAPGLAAYASDQATGSGPSAAIHRRLELEEVDMNLIDPALLGFAPPGFSAVITVSKAMDFSNGGGSVDYTDGRALLPVWAHETEDGTVFGATLAYGWASLDASGALGLPRQNLNTLELQLTAAHFPKGDEGWMGLAIVSPGLTTDFKNVSSDDFSFSAIVVAGYQFSPRFTLSAAAFYAHSIGEDTVAPGIGVVWRPNEQWIVQLTPPIGAVGWSPNKNWIFSLSAYPSGSAWGIDQEGKDRNTKAIQLEGWRAGLDMERRVGDHLRLSVQVGMNFGGQLELRDRNGGVLFNRDLDSSPFGLLGAAWNF